MKPTKVMLVFLMLVSIPSSIQILSSQNITLSTSSFHQAGDYRAYLPLLIKEGESLYNRVAAAAYADQWAHDRNGTYPNFGTGCDCNDCTNYASQVLHEGAYPLRIGDWDANSPFEWWYKPVLWWYENSNTWSATDWFNVYVYQYPDEFEIGNFGSLTNGDFMVMDTRQNDGSGPPDGIPDHIRVIIGHGYTSTNVDDYACQPNPVPSSAYTLLANQHCVDRQHVAWNYNFQPAFGLWYVHVSW